VQQEELSRSDDLTLLQRDWRGPEWQEAPILAAPLTVLIVDDEEDVRRLVRFNLELDRRFHVIDDVESGDLAVVSVRRNRPDVVLLDMMMPGMNGGEVLSQVRRLSPNTKVVMYSAASVAACEYLTAHGADLYLPKTTQIVDLSEQIANLEGAGRVPPPPTEGVA
jgi:CheY-like chemotaxis protein